MFKSCHKSQGYTLIEVLTTVTLVAIVAVAVLIVINPAQQFIKVRDSARVTSITNLSQALDAYAIAYNGKYPPESSRWITDLVEAGEIKDEPIPIDYNYGGVAPCNLNQQHYYCYNAATPDGEGPVVVFAALENRRRCDSDQTPYVVYSTADRRGGIVCTSDEAPRPGEQPFEEEDPSPTPQESPVLANCNSTEGTIQVTTPNGGERYSFNDTINIGWCLNDFSQYNQTYSSIWLSSRETQTNGSFVYRNQRLLADNISMTNGVNSYSWTIPSDIPEAGSYVFLVSINRFFPNYDHSDDAFTIGSSSESSIIDPDCFLTSGTTQVLSPNGGETYYSGNTLPISWCVNDYSQYNQYYASIWLTSRETQSNGTYVYPNQIELADNLWMEPGKNTYNWTVPEDVSNGGSFVVLVSLNSMGVNGDYSNDTFTLLKN